MPSDSQKELRCFIGLEIPSAVKKQLATKARELQNDKSYSDFKWVRKSNYHLTLHFIGEIPLNKVVELKEALEEAPVIESPFEVELSEICGFPTREKPKFIVAALKDNATLTQLRNEIKDRLETVGISVDEDHFRPHISLGRLKRGHQPPEIGHITDVENTISLETYSVFKSTLTPEGSVYEVIGSFGKPKPKPITLEDLIGE